MTSPSLKLPMAPQDLSSGLPTRRYLVLVGLINRLVSAIAYSKSQDLAGDIYVFHCWCSNHALNTLHMSPYVSSTTLQSKWGNWVSGKLKHLFEFKQMLNSKVVDQTRVGMTLNSMLSLRSPFLIALKQTNHLNQALPVTWNKQFQITWQSIVNTGPSPAM